MKPGRASVTAQRAAAHRLTFTRVSAPFGDSATGWQRVRRPGTGARAASAGFVVAVLK